MKTRLIDVQGFSNASNTELVIVNAIGDEILNLKFSDDGSDIIIRKEKIPLNQGVDLLELMRSEKYRIKIALKYSETNREAYELLMMAPSTFYRKCRKMKIKNHRNEHKKN